MRKRIIRYRKLIDETLKNIETIENIDDLISEHLTQISFFQHERLVHLLVTLAFAVITFGIFITMIITGISELGIVCLLLLLLLIPYIGHYYILENETQKMYYQFDKMMEIKKERKG